MIARARRTSPLMSMWCAVAVGALAVHALLAVMVWTVIADGNAIGDWVSFYSAGTIMRLGDGAHLYEPGVQIATQQSLFGSSAVLNNYPLPAFFALAIAPLTALSFAQSYAVWLAINVVLLAALSVATYRWFVAKGVRNAWLFVACGALSLPVVNLVLLGQVDLFVVAAFAGCYVLLVRKQPLAAGAVLAIAVVKPHLVIAPLLMLALCSERRALAGFAAVAFPLLLVPALILGPETLADQLAFVRGAAAADGEQGRVNAEVMVNVRGLVVSLTNSDSMWLWLPPMLIVAGAAFAAAVMVWRRQRSATDLQTWALVFVLPAVYSPHLHVHSFVLLLGAAAFYVAADAQAGRHSIRAERVLGAFACVTALWLVSLSGVAVMCVLALVMLRMIVRAWPEVAAAVPDVLEKDEPELKAA